jgi:hypothetical protein
MGKKSMMVKGKRDFTIVQHGKATIDVSELFQDGESVEVVVLEDCDKILDKTKIEQASKKQIILHMSDEVYEHIIYLLKHLEGVEIVEDKYIEEKDQKC